MLMLLPTLIGGIGTYFLKKKIVSFVLGILSNIFGIVTLPQGDYDKMVSYESRCNRIQLEVAMCAGEYKKLKKSKRRRR